MGHSQCRNDDRYREGGCEHDGEEEDRCAMCVQETRWKGQKAQEMENSYKLYYTDEDCKRNGVGIVLSPGLKEGVLQVNRESSRLI